MIHPLRYYPPHRTRPIPADPEAHLCFWFQRWLGRPLIPVEQRTIIPMERRRRLGLACRFFIDDTGRYGTIIRDILLDYVRYLSETILRGRDTFIIARTKREARLLATPAFGPRLHRNPRLRLLSAKRPADMRSRPVDIALALNAETYGHYMAPPAMTLMEVSYYPNYEELIMRGLTWPQRRQCYGRFLDTLASSISSCRGSMVIIHGNPRVHPRSQYARHLRESRSDLGAYTVICPETDIARRELRSLEAVVASIENLDATDPADHHYRPPRPGPRILILAPRAYTPDPDATASSPPAIKIPV